MNVVLEKIIAEKERDLGERKKRISLEELKGQIEAGPGRELFYRAIIEAVNDPAIIGEVKFASPGTSLRPATPIAEGLDLTEDLMKRVRQYEVSGVDAISIITEPHFFKGDIDFVGKVKKVVNLPILQKDFVIDEYQIYEAAQEGADGLLLIARLVDKKTLKKFVDLCQELGIEPVVEVFSEEDLEKAAVTGTKFVAVNARDLDTFEIDVDKACELMKKIPEGFIRLGFSGIQSKDEVRQYKEAGARGILIGTSLMQTKNVGEFLEGIGSRL